MGAHRRRVRLRPPRLPARPRGLQARDQRVRSRRRRADVARGALEPCLLARPRAGPPRGYDRDRARRRQGPQQCVLPLGDPLGRAPRLRDGRPDLRRPLTRVGELGAGARGGARGGGRARGAPGVAGSAVARIGRAGVRVRRPRQRRVRGAGRADRVAPDDRALDDRGQRAGGAAARFPAGADSLPGPRATRRDRGRAADRPAGVARCPDAAGAEGDTSPRSRPPI